MIDENEPVSETAESGESALKPVGAAYVSAHLPFFPERPGVYRMLDKAGKILYVGKAKNLRRRLENYARPERTCMRIQRMISQIDRIEIIETTTEAEAFLLENDLIKRLKPYYNILLKDDKTFPHILITTRDEWPQVMKHRGARDKKGEYFGPFASVLAVNETLEVLQKAFLLRTCTDNVFYHRARPCLLHQIKRCSAPCAGKISREDYRALADEACAFMHNKSTKIQEDLAKKMERASLEMRFEEAAVLRDRIRALNRIQAQSGDLHGRGTDLRTGVFLPRRAQLRKFRGVSDANGGTDRRRDFAGFFGAVLHDPFPAAGNSAVDSVARKRCRFRGAERESGLEGQADGRRARQSQTAG